MNENDALNHDAAFYFPDLLFSIPPAVVSAVFDYPADILLHQGFGCGFLEP
ncbi:MAG: hypothetical protein ACLTDX_25120 [[Clostridium] innocuum]